MLSRVVGVNGGHTSENWEQNCMQGSWSEWGKWGHIREELYAG